MPTLGVGPCPPWTYERGDATETERVVLQNNRELFYSFSPQLMQNVPAETVDAWISKRDLLDPRRLIPALVQYDASQASHSRSRAV